MPSTPTDAKMNPDIGMQWLPASIREAVESNRALLAIFLLGLLLFAGSIGVGLFYGVGERSGLPFGALAYRRVAVEYAQAGNRYRAEQEYRAEQRINNGNSGLVLKLVETLRAAGRNEEALEALRNGAENSLDSGLHLEFALALQHRGLLPESERVIRRAITIEPGRAALRTRLGMFLFAIGDTQGAVAAYEEALALSPEAIGAKMGLQRVYAKSPHLEQQRPPAARDGS